jgi:hypothetical protein
MANVDTIISSTTSAVTSLTQQCITAVANLNNLAAGWTAYNITSPATLTLNDYSVLYAELQAAKTSILSYTSAVFNVTLNLAGVDPPTLTTYNTAQWNESNWTQLHTALDSFISTIGGADDIDTIITKLTSDFTTKREIAIFEKDYERKSQVLRDLYSAASASTGAKGFLYPNIITVALKLKAQQDFQFSLEETGRILINHIYEWAKANWQFSIEKGITAQQADMDFNIRFANLLITRYTAQLNGLIDAYKAQISTIIQQAEHKLKEYMINIELLKTRSSVLTTQDENRVKLYQSQTADVIKRLEMAILQESNITNNKIHAYSAAATASASMATSSSQIVLATAS